VIARSAEATRLAADTLVIGSGAGGSCVADVLTAAGLDVLMVEEGPRVPAEAAAPRATEAFPRSWRGGGLTVALGAPPIAYAEGRCVGGGTEINSAIFQEVDPDLLDFWGRLYRIADFSAAGLAPFYARAASVVNASFTPGPAGPPTEVLTRAGEALGWSVTPLKRGQRDCVGTNLCSFVCPTGGKQSMSATLIPQALDRGLRLLADTRVERLEQDGSRVTAALARRRHEDGSWEFVRIETDRIFVCGGAIQTPALLRRSGVARRVGATLRLHPTIKCIALFDRDLDADRHRLPLAAITQFMPDQRIGGSVFTPALFALGLAEDWTVRRHLMEDWRRCGTYYAMIRPIGIGSVRPLPFAAEPLVRFALAPEDWTALGRALSRLGAAMFAAGAQLVYPSISGHPGWTRPDQVCEFLDRPLPKRRTNLMTIHLFGSCPMGEDRDACAVDSFGRVHGFDNLVVADASVIPEAPGANPQATIMALAFRFAEAALASGRLRPARPPRQEPVRVRA
jgi:choline dehydrogenase-like flavoprotein